MIVLFADGVAEVFEELPENVKRQAAHSIELLSAYPRMYPLRRRGLMRGYRYFIASQFLLLLLGRDDRGPHHCNHSGCDAGCMM